MVLVADGGVQLGLAQKMEEANHERQEEMVRMFLFSRYSKKKVYPIPQKADVLIFIYLSCDLGLHHMATCSCGNNYRLYR